MTVLLIVSILFWGFVIGGLARWAVPGPDPMPVWGTIALGIGGSLVGGLVGRIFLGVSGGLLLAFAGAVVLLIVYRHFVQHRPLTGPDAHRPPR